MSLINTISGLDYTGTVIDVKVGDRVIVHAEGHRASFCDVVRACYIDHVCLEPYGRNFSRPAVVLTCVSNAPLSNIELDPLW
jgi:hypothetical protein